MLPGGTKVRTMPCSWREAKTIFCAASCGTARVIRLLPGFLTAAVGGDVADALPLLFVAMTVTISVSPVSLVSIG